MSTIHVKGIHRVGTNYMEQLIAKHFSLTPFIHEMRDHSWKHGRVPRHKGIDLKLKSRADNKIVVMIKNPYTWYNSIMRWVAGTNPKIGKPLEPCFGTGSLEDVYKRYNLLYTSHKELLSSDYSDTVYTDGVLVRYEDLLINPEAELKKISNKFDIKWKRSFEDVKSVPQSTSFNANRERRIKYYLEQRPNYSEKEVTRVTVAVNWSLMSFYDYQEV